MRCLTTSHTSLNVETINPTARADGRFEEDFDDGGGQSLGSRPTGTTVLGRFTNCILGGGGAF